MKPLITIQLFFLLHVSVIGNGQQHKYFKFYSLVYFMPAGGFKKEIYEMHEKQLFHFSETLTYKKPKKIVKTKLPKDTAFNIEINELDSLLKLNTFNLIFDDSLIYKIKSDTFLKKYYRLKDLEIDNFFEKKKIFQISLNDIPG